jgi:hypothetical protein
MGARRQPLWACPRCGAKLVAENMSHACGAFSVDAFLAGKGRRGRALFARFTRCVAACGPYELAPAKTRIAFLSRVRFASVNRLSDEAIDVHFVLPRCIDSPRIRRVEKVGNVFVHHLRLVAPADFDDELRSWLAAAREEYGERRWLERPGGGPSPRG